MGGECWRRWEPHQPSKNYGKVYESWEWSGSPADIAGRWLASREGYPSRVDIAFDLACDASCDPRDVQEACRAHWDAVGFTPGLSGEGDVFTAYVGARSAPRRIRIYRRDRKDEVVADQQGPVLRVELVLRAEHSRGWWDDYRRDEQVGLKLAACHVANMTGYRLLEFGPDVVIPKIDEPDTEEVGTLFHFIEQHGPMLNEYLQAGVDIEGLAAEKAANVSKVTAWRVRRRAARIKRMGADFLTDMAYELLAAKWSRS